MDCFGGKHSSESVEIFYFAVQREAFIPYTGGMDFLLTCGASRGLLSLGNINMPLFSIDCETCGARLAVHNTDAIGNILACPKCEGMVMVTAAGRLVRVGLHHTAFGSEGRWRFPVGGCFIAPLQPLPLHRKRLRKPHQQRQPRRLGQPRHRLSKARRILPMFQRRATEIHRRLRHPHPPRKLPKRQFLRSSLRQKRHLPHCHPSERISQLSRQFASKVFDHDAPTADAQKAIDPADIKRDEEMAAAVTAQPPEVPDDAAASDSKIGQTDASTLAGTDRASDARRRLDATKFHPVATSSAADRGSGLWRWPRRLRFF